MNILNHKPLNKLLKLAAFLMISSNLIANTSNTDITTTINPISFLIKEVVGDKNKVNTLLPNSSPHVSGLKPSQVQMLNNSGVIFYIDENLETFMPKLLPQITGVKIVNIVDSLNLQLLDNRTTYAKKKQDEHDEHESHQGHDHDNHDEHNHGTKDMHIWLSPKVATHITYLIAEKLSEFYPKNAKFYQQNANKTIDKLQQMDNKIHKMLSKKSDKKVIIFHNAYNYFLHNYDLEDIIANAVKSKNISIKKIFELKENIERDNVSCVLSDAKYSTKTINKLIKNTNAKHKILSPFGNISDVKSDYYTLINNMANTIGSCR
jgi:zinc transport system substrate-binding protein